MIPDKIYIPLYPNYNLDGIRLGDDWMYEPHKEYDNAEYIRKDALLEWAKEQKTLMELGGHVFIDDIIDKLNSM